MVSAAFATSASPDSSLTSTGAVTGAVVAEGAFTIAGVTVGAIGAAGAEMVGAALAAATEIGASAVASLVEMPCGELGGALPRSWPSFQPQARDVKKEVKSDAPVLSARPSVWRQSKNSEKKKNVVANRGHVVCCAEVEARMRMSGFGVACGTISQGRAARCTWEGCAADEGRTGGNMENQKWVPSCKRSWLGWARLR